MAEDLLRGLDESLERDQAELIVDGFGYWTGQLVKFDAGEQVLDQEDQVMTRDKVVECVQILREMLVDALVRADKEKEKNG